MNNNFISLIITFIASLTWLRLNDFAAHKGWIGTQLSRKIIHMGTGPIFVVCWLLFDDSISSRYLAAIVPLAITFQFALVGLGIIKDEAAVKAMSRTGDPKEILRGPLFYGIIFVIVTIYYWLDSAVGITALMLMCGGDGLADIVGRRWGRKKLPWARDKSWIGSLGMFLGGLVFSLGIIGVFIASNVLINPLSSYLLPITVIVFLSTVVESLPLKDIDNITVTFTALVLGQFLLIY